MKPGEKIREVRKRLGISQYKMAASIGMSQTNFNAIEKGRIGVTGTVARCVEILYHLPDGWIDDEENTDFSIVTGDNLFYADTMEKFLKLKPNYRNYISTQLDGLLKLQEEEEAKTGEGDGDEERISSS